MDITPSAKTGPGHRHPAMVGLRPPLPFVGQQHGAGFVTGLTMDELWLDLAGPTQPGQTERAETLHLRLPDGVQQSLAVRLDSEASADGWRARPATSSDRDRLRDLLNILRKDQHIEICAQQDIEGRSQGVSFADVLLQPRSLPELSWDQIDTTTSLFGRQFAAPVLITGMTGGLAKGAEINRRLAAAAAHHGIPMGVGSQRLALENSEFAAIFAVKQDQPDVFLIGNLGVSQLISDEGVEQAQRAVDMIQADAMAIHVNVLQELVQVEGDRDFSGLLPQLERLVKALPVPVVVKEVGAGVDPHTAQRLHDIGVAAIDVGGQGGTSWSAIEGRRARDTGSQKLGEEYRDWGLPTPVALGLARQTLPQMPLIATGGLRTGLQVAQAVALGATSCGIGLPLLRAALDEDPLAAQHFLTDLLRSLRVAMLCTGASKLADLSRCWRPRPALTTALELYRPRHEDEPAR